ncbi:MAG: sugar phosphate isomerase/epimerase [Chloroflexota bacterium]|nr:sugar phosphate isomerase/epimerase [Chloroflexota bacterium]
MAQPESTILLASSNALTPLTVAEGRNLMKPKNRVSCHLITWGQDLDTAIREAHQLGFQACETFTHQAMEYEDRVQEFEAKLREGDLMLSALYGGGRFSDPSKADQVVEYNTRVARFLNAMNVDRIVFGPGGPREDKTGADGLKQMAKTIDEAAKRTADLGVLACVHPHLGTELQDRDELDAVMEMTNPDYVFFCPDTAHLTAAGMDAAEVIRTYGSRMRYMHIKDLTPQDPDPEAFKHFQGTEALPIFCELGLGTIDFGPIMQAIEDVGYTDWITVEIDVSTSTPYESLRQCRDFVQNELGLSVRFSEA